MAFSRCKAPIDPGLSRFLLRQKRITQKQLAEELAIAPGTVSLFLDGQSYSQRFWDLYFQRVPEARQHIAA